MLTACALHAAAQSRATVQIILLIIVDRFIWGNRIFGFSISVLEQRRFQQIGRYPVKLFHIIFIIFLDRLDWALWRHRADLLGARV